MSLLIGVVVLLICAPTIYAMTMALAGAALDNRVGLLVAIPVVVALIIFAALTA